MSNESLYYIKQTPQRIEWTDDWLVDDKKIDEQHKTIITLINLFFDENYSHIQKTVTLPQTITYMLDHLDTEEKILKKSGYPKFSEHKKLHNVFRQKADNYLASLNKNNKIDDSIINFFETWWLKHIIDEDTKFKSYVSK